MLSDKIIVLRSKIFAEAASFGVFKVGFAPLEGISLSGDVQREALGMDHAVSLVFEISATAAYDREKEDRFYQAMVDGRGIMDRAAVSIARLLEGEGYRVLPVTSKYTMDQGNIIGQISHKAVAHQAGLGWIGRSTLFVTPEFGPRVRLLTILTDAVLDEGARPMDNRCGSCRACIVSCPLKALHYSEFDGYPGDRSEVFDVLPCHRQEKAWLDLPEPRFCARCISVCPKGKIK